MLEDMPVAVFKIGVLGSVEIIAAIAEVVSDYPDVPLMLDPVLASGRGDELATDEMVEAHARTADPADDADHAQQLEARRLAHGRTDENDDPTLAECARRLLDLGCEYVLITGTHENTAQVVNTLYGRRGRGPQRQLAAPAGQASTAPAARLPRRSPPRSPTACRSRRRCATHRSTHGRRSRPRSVPAWVSRSRIVCSGRVRPTGLDRRGRLRDNVAGLYAVTPESLDTPCLLRAVGAALAGGAGCCSTATSAATRRAEAAQTTRCWTPAVATRVPAHRERRRRARASEGCPWRACGPRRRAAGGRARMRSGPGDRRRLVLRRTRTRARRAQAAGADYVAFGSFFPS